MSVFGRVSFAFVALCWLVIAPARADLAGDVRNVLRDPSYAKQVAALRAELHTYTPMQTIENAILQASATPHALR